MNGNFNQVDSMDYSKIMSQKYRGINVWFGPSTDNDVMIFVTDALRLFPNKRISDFLNSKQTQELIEQISSETGISASQICYSTKGKYSDGRPQGTWMRRELALAFAMWLSSEFYLWCLNRLLELFSNGYVVLNQRNLDQIINDNPELQNIINQLQNENQRLKQDNYNLQNQMNNWGPKASYYDQVLQNSEYQYTLRDIQQSLGLKVSYKTVSLPLTSLFIQLLTSYETISTDCSTAGFFRHRTGR